MCGGDIYSLEGFAIPSENLPVLRLIDVNSQKQIQLIYLADYGADKEPEFIDYVNGTLYYGECNGNLYELFFDQDACIRLSMK